MKFPCISYDKFLEFVSDNSSSLLTLENKTEEFDISPEFWNGSFSTHNDIVTCICLTNFQKFATDWAYILRNLYEIELYWPQRKMRIFFLHFSSSLKWVYLDSQSQLSIQIIQAWGMNPLKMSKFHAKAVESTSKSLLYQYFPRKMSGNHMIIVMEGWGNKIHITWKPRKKAKFPGKEENLDTCDNL